MAVLAIACAACAHHPGQEPTPEGTSGQSGAAEALLGYRAAFTMSWRGARMGSAVEELVRATDHEDGFRFRRSERLVVRRGDALVPHETHIDIETDGALRAVAVSVVRSAGPTTIKGGAERDASGDWRVWFGDQPIEVLDGDAVPAELVGLLVASRADRSFDGTAFMPGYGFAVARLRVHPSDDARRQLEAVAETAYGSIVSHIDIGADGTVRRVRDATGVSAARVAPSDLGAPFDPPELVDSASVAIDGDVPPRGRVALVVDHVARTRPPALPGQELVIETESSWHLVLAAGDRGTAEVDAVTVAPTGPELAGLAARIITDAGARGRAAEIVALTRATAALLEDDLAAVSTTAGGALALGRGDCTAHATLFAALAGARGIATRLVTGYRIDGSRLVRHRWALAAIGDSWVTIDPTYGEAPARPRLLGLAVHGSAAAELAVVDSLTFAGTENARARVLPWRD